MTPSARTNQVLYFARLSLDEAEAASQPQEKRRHEETALFHLYSAFSGFLNELSTQYMLAPFKSPEDLLGREGLQAEFVELEHLSKESDSWLGVILNQYNRVLLTGLEQGPANSNLITKQSDYTHLFRNALNDMEKVIQRMREHCQEY